MTEKAIEAAYPLTPQQEEVLRDYLAKKDPGYHCLATLKYEGMLDIAQLTQALLAVMYRHPVLRTSFVWKRVSTPMQVVLAEAKGNVVICDPTPTSEEQNEAWKVFCEQEKKQNFDPGKAPLLRMAVCSHNATTHRWVFTAHRLILDEMGLQHVIQEVAGHYDALMQQEEHNPPKVLRFRDYIAWYKQQPIDKAQVFWSEVFRDRVILPSLFLDKSVGTPPPVKQHRGFCEIEIAAGDLARHAQNNGFSKDIYLKAAWAIVVSRHHQMDDVVLGVANSDGLHRGEEHPYRVGPLPLLYPFRVTVPESEPVGEWLIALNARHKEFERHGYVALSQIQEWCSLGPESLWFESCVVGPLEHDEFAQSPSNTIDGYAYAPLTLQECWRPGTTTTTTLTLRANYDAQRFQPESIQRVLEQVKCAMESIVPRWNHPVADLPILSVVEQQRLVFDFNKTTVSHEYRSFPDLFEMWAAQTPDVVALILEDRTLTYDELNRRSNQVAHCLKKQGVEAETVVGLCVDRSFEMVIGLLGVMKAGGAYVPLDPSYPLERLSFIMNDVTPAVVLTQEHLEDRLPVTWAQVLYLDEVESMFEDESDANLGIEHAPETLAYIIHTSGSTGKPKGVCAIHQGLTNMIFGMQTAFGVDHTSTFLQFASLNFDASTAEFGMVFGSGATLCLGTQENLMPGPLLIDLLQKHRVTHAVLPPTALRALPYTNLPHLQMLGVAGEPCAPDLIQQWSTGRRFFNAYGPTENTVCSTVGDTVSEDGTMPIGRPLNNIQTYILDRQQRPVPIGVPGELYIGGASLARGYFNRPELTESKFVINPLTNSASQTEPARLYKSGDLVCYLPDGNIKFLGRIDNQVKVRGFRIELGEIESVLSWHDHIHDAVVVARRDEGDARLVAYVVLKPDVEPQSQIALLRTHLQGYVPDYMLPSAFVFLDSLPQTPNGKVDRKALAEHENYLPNRTPTENYAAPRNAIEGCLVDIWKNLLRLDQVGIHDNFFEIGGDSIISIQMVARVKKAGWHLMPRDIFRNQTIADLAMVAAESEEANGIDQGPVMGDAPLLPIQHWFFQRQVADPHHFNQAMSLTVNPHVDVDRLVQALRKLITHHDALRLRFTEIEGVWKQAHTLVDEDTNNAGQIPFTAIDLSALPPDEQRITMEHHAGELQASLDLSQGPLVRMVLFQRGADLPGVLLWVIHHFLVDGVSWRILLEDLVSVYEQLQNDEPVQLPDKTTSFQTWGTALVEYAKEEAISHEVRFWTRHLQGADPSLPTETAITPSNNTQASTNEVSCVLSSDETQQLLQDVPPVYRTHINDLLLAALVQALFRWTGKRSFLIDLEGHGREAIREDIDLSRTVGWCTTAFPVHLKHHSETQHPGDLIKSIKEQLREIPGQGLGFGVLKYLKQDPEIVALPPASVSFNYLGQFDNMESSQETQTLLLGAADIDRGPLSSEKQQRSHLLEVNGSVSRGQLRFSWAFSKHLHRDTVMQAVADDFLEALQQLIAHCVSPEAGGYTPSDFPETSLTQAELDRLVNQVPTMEALYPLSPSQLGMLVGTLAAQQTGIYVEQLVGEWNGALNLNAYQQAWNSVIQQHTMLRTGFIWEDLAEPLQFVRPEAEVPLIVEDWSPLEAAEQETRLNAFLTEDRQRGFDMNHAPLMRLAVLQTDPDRYHLIWTQHHILLDGWCCPLILQEVSEFYQAIITPRQPVKPSTIRPYRDYIAWLQAQEIEQARAYWEARLQGFLLPTPLVTKREDDTRQNKDSVANPAQSEMPYGEHPILFSKEATDQLKTLVRNQQVTLNTFMQAVWAFLLGSYSEQTDVLFGATVSGRPSELAGVEKMIGLFINTVPIRVRLKQEQPFSTWIQDLQTEIAEQQAFEYCASGQIQQWSEVPGSMPLYESLLVLENYASGSDSAAAETMTPVRTKQSVGAQTAYPLTLVIAPKEQLSVRAIYQTRCFDTPHVEQLVRGIQHVCQEIVRHPQIPLLDLQRRLPQELRLPVVSFLERQPSENRSEFVAPRSIEEQNLFQIFQEVLGHPAISITDNFFELGGHSLLAVRLMALIHKRFGVNLPLATLFQHPSIETLAQALLGFTASQDSSKPHKATEAWSSLVPIQTRGPKPPFFCLPGGGGNALYFYHLSRHLGNEQPFYGLQPVGLDGKQTPHTSVQAMAAHHLSLIQEIQPQGPYYLGGHSFGGRVAFEIAQQLLAAGESIALLAILDVPPFSEVTVEEKVDEAHWLSSLIVAAVEFHGTASSDPRDQIRTQAYEQLRQMPQKEQWQYVQQQLEATHFLPPGSDLQQVQGYIQVFQANAQATYAYQPQNWRSLPITLFCPEDEPNASVGRTAEGKAQAWSQIGPVELHRVPGSHVSMTAEPHVKVLADKLRGCIEKAT